MEEPEQSRTVQDDGKDLPKDGQHKGLRILARIIARQILQKEKGDSPPDHATQTDEEAQHANSCDAR